VNVFRTPGLLDRERADEISALADQLRTVRQAPSQLESQFAALMQEGASLKQKVIQTQDLQVINNEWVRDWKTWKERVRSSLRDAGWLTDSEAFTRASENPSKNVLGDYVHIAETKRLYVVLLKMECDKLEEIVQRRLSRPASAASSSFNSSPQD
jgi:septal ring factor EnvC (AmiA/AmiB activator)